ncbi:helix-turn-helix domain-containing protein [Amycolatopsis australiensis]|uniref:Helix-turn-helix n=1 Tax=Amycolatopsis australiensis TaxID=546364 RepID=A0A1K1LS51_9PSEU|nr:helix-turn-helix transcriptional regulator [Amycolatopsis australiensis]SFW13757.1 Helix-turn-helix [Amycolatopsis australiensis]
MSARDRTDEGTRFRQALGEELRQARLQAGLTTRAQLSRRLRERGRHVETEKTIASWERGERDVSVGALIQVCNAMDTHAADLLRRVEWRLQAEKSGHVPVELHQLTNTDDPLLQPLRGWARSQAPSHVNHSGPISLWLPPEAVVAAARQCGVNAEEILDKLQKLSRSPSRPVPPDGVADSGEGRLR